MAMSLAEQRELADLRAVVVETRNALIETRGHLLKALDRIAALEEQARKGKGAR